MALNRYGAIYLNARAFDPVAGPILDFWMRYPLTIVNSFGESEMNFIAAKGYPDFVNYVCPKCGRYYPDSGICTVCPQIDPTTDKFIGPKQLEPEIPCKESFTICCLCDKFVHPQEIAASIRALTEVGHVEKKVHYLCYQDKLENNRLSGVSMGCKVEESECSICYDTSGECRHLKPQHVFPPKYHEISPSVTEPADKSFIKFKDGDVETVLPPGESYMHSKPKYYPETTKDGILTEIPKEGWFIQIGEELSDRVYLDGKLVPAVQFVQVSVGVDCKREAIIHINRFTARMITENPKIYGPSIAKLGIKQITMEEGIENIIEENKHLENAGKWIESLQKLLDNAKK